MVNIITNEDEFLFPLYLKESIVVIYGADEIGKQVYTGAKAKPDHCGVVPSVNFFIDKKASSIKQIENVPVISFASFKKMLNKLPNTEINIIIASLDVDSSNKIEIKLVNQLDEYKNNTFNIFSMISYDLEIDKFGFKKGKRININPFCFQGYEHIEEFNQNPYHYLSEVTWGTGAEFVNTSFNSPKFKKFKSKYWNSENGLRKTICSKEKYKHNIYILGYSRIAGLGNEDQYTISSQLQKLIDNSNYDYKVHNNSKPNPSDRQLNNSLLLLFIWLKNLNLAKGDIVICSVFYAYQSIYDYKYLMQAKLIKSIKKYCDKYCAKLYILFWMGTQEKFILTQNELNLINYVNRSAVNLEIYNLNNRAYVNQKAIQLKRVFQEICLVNEVNFIDLNSMLNAPDMNDKIFTDSWAHYTPKANEYIAKLMFEEIFNKNTVEEFNNEATKWFREQIDMHLQILLTDDTYSKLELYIEDIKLRSELKKRGGGVQQVA
ncbi:hypothetical protein AN641_10310 [Candidatus Epulonipiscioides gigas]|nr:hypothetical protein AN641_10310 [Epulopiscium sp. SCG-C07WGA-EpuloA2]